MPSDSSLYCMLAKFQGRRRSIRTGLHTCPFQSSTAHHHMLRLTLFRVQETEKSVHPCADHLASIFVYASVFSQATHPRELFLPSHLEMRSPEDSSTATSPPPPHSTETCDEGPPALPPHSGSNHLRPRLLGRLQPRHPTPAPPNPTNSTTATPA